MDKIYVVTSGDYSDYGIDAIFTSEELAQAFINGFKERSYQEFRIEEHKLNPYKNEIRKGYFAFFVRMQKDGVCKEVYKSDSAYGFNGGIDYGFDINNGMCCHVFAKDDKHAVKIANEKRIELIALNKWKQK